MELKQLFNELHLNQTHFAIKLGVSKGYLSDMLNGNRPMKKEPELRTYLRNHATEINNYLDKTVDIRTQV